MLPLSPFAVRFYLQYLTRFPYISSHFLLTFLIFSQPLHPCLFPQSSRFSTFSRVTNPFEGVYDGVAVLGHSGQPVSDIARQRRDQVPKSDDAGECVLELFMMQILCCNDTMIRWW